jgi:hypothetical protein
MGREEDDGFFRQLKLFNLMELLFVDDYFLVNRFEKSVEEIAERFHVFDVEIGDEKVANGISRFYLLF